jgi:hypothetical protein
LKPWPALDDIERGRHVDFSQLLGGGHNADGTPVVPGFLGFVSTGAAIQSITFSAATIVNPDNANFFVDNFTYGVDNPAGPLGQQVAITPEPAPIALLTVGLIALVLFSRQTLSRSERI